MGRKGLLQFIVPHHSRKAGAGTQEGQELGGRKELMPWWKAAYWFAPPDLFSLLPNTDQEPPARRMVPFIVGGGGGGNGRGVLPHLPTPIIKTIPPQIYLEASLMKSFS